MELAEQSTRIGEKRLSTLSTEDITPLCFTGEHTTILMKLRMNDDSIKTLIEKTTRVSSFEEPLHVHYPT
jgi:hypothetical protein